MNPICTNPFHEELIQEVLQLIGQVRLDDAFSSLLVILDQLPEEWEYFKETPETVQVAFWDLDEYTSYERYRKEIGLKKPAIWVRPSYSHALYLIAYILVEKKDFPSAMEIIEKLIDIEPDHPCIIYEKGLIHSHMKEPERAIDCFQKSLFLRPWATNRQKAKALRGLGVSYIDLNHLEQAEVVLRKSLEIEPMNNLALNELGLIDELKKGSKLSGKHSLFYPNKLE